MTMSCTDLDLPAAYTTTTSVHVHCFHSRKAAVGDDERAIRAPIYATLHLRGLDDLVTTGKSNRPHPVGAIPFHSLTIPNVVINLDQRVNRLCVDLRLVKLITRIMPTTSLLVDLHLLITQPAEVPSFTRRNQGKITGT
ncbi:hypothetical protein RRF57_000163 [Xylaria bambusicola]|uniref:Uncharacterized protein n=1 Tax=Xylaria bambusicola TaxID=326684 RepID=A0AAN7UBN9_9PEZI